jgi:hypothetical protein
MTISEHLVPTVERALRAAFGAATSWRVTTITNSTR